MNMIPVKQKPIGMHHGVSFAEAEMVFFDPQAIHDPFG
ncbi:MAG: BrnT family toxin [Moorea sp. SIO4G3]|nr:BrnT family toxin [Moorena sp. SIO4G3]